MQSAGAAESAADFIAASGFAHMMHDDERGSRGIAQPEQRLTKSRHRARIIFILVMRGVERIEDDDLGFSRTSGSEEVIQAGRGTEQMNHGTRIDEQIRVGGIAKRLAHRGQPHSELRCGQFKLTDQDAAWSRDKESGMRAAGSQGEREIGDEQGFADLGFAANEEDTVGRQQSRLNERRRRYGVVGEQFGQRHNRAARSGCGGGGGGHRNASCAASSKTASSTIEAFRVAAKRKAASESLLTLRRMPFVA